MSRYIDADALKKSVEGLTDCYNGFSDTYDKSCIIGLIDEEPTADVVEVVRCRDCKHRKNVIPDMYGIGTEALFCRAINRYVEHDFFCKYGEKVSE